MRQSMFRLLTLLVLSYAVLGAPPPARAQGIEVFVDGRRLVMDQPAVMQGGKTLVPLRGIFEALGATVVWDAPTRTIRAQKDTTEIALPLGSYNATVNGQVVQLDTPAQTLGGRTMVPLRFIGEALGAKVEWRGATRTVLITSGAGGTGPTPSAGDPVIRDVVASPQRTLRPGDTLTVVMMGDAGGQAAFDIVGVRDSLEMRETSSGRYQGALTIQQGMSAQSAALVVRLVRNGLTSTRQAGTVTIEAGGGGALQVTEFPTPNSTVADRRPSIGITFSNPVNRNDLRLWVDGRDFTNEASLSATQFLWRPSYDLGLGVHNARVAGRDAYGNTVDRQWSFTVSPQSQATRFPGAGATLDSTRPTIGMSFSQAVRTETARLWVDGQEFTGQARVTPYDIVWVPGYDLSPGTHTVRVDAVTTTGAALHETWSFSIGGAGGPGTGLINSMSLSPNPPYNTGQAVTVTLYGAPGGYATMTVGTRSGLALPEVASGTYQGDFTVMPQDTSTRIVVTLRMPDGRSQTVQSSQPVQINPGGANPMRLNVTSPVNGQGVPGNFNIIGTTMPNAMVEVTAQARQALIPGVISIGGKTWSNAVRADGSGHFNLPLSAGDAKAGTTLDVRVQARDDFGNLTAPVEFQVVRQ